MTHDREYVNIDYLMKKLNLKLREQAVANLMCGNDTQCFTTEQFVLECKTVFKTDWRDHEYELKLARYGLETLHNVIEVKPNVWTLKESK